MKTLEKTLRNVLERTVREAREIAEEASRVALEQLGVGESKAYPHLSDDDRKLRRRLRAHGRQLGNGRNANGEQELDRLIEEVAYEHWHRMLFARFLAENNLLMYPDPDDPVAVTLEECEDLAADEGAANGWELAARYAARMLPQIFRLESPVFQLELPPEHQQKLERLVANLSPNVFMASDSLGWVYQFWQSKKKDEVNASEVKIGARELPAVTQLFTEPYMVSFLLDNALGAWWAARRLSAKDIEEVSTKYTNDTKKIEEELRKRASIPGVSLEYLRFVKQEDVHEIHEQHEKKEKNRSCLSCGSWTPAAGTFDGWPDQLADLKILDPCCGSGHFLVAAFLMLVPMRMELEGLSAKEAVDAVLLDNIHGLELDQRCVALAAFALALTAWKYPDAGGYRVLPELNLACSGLSVSVAKEEWKQLGLGKKNLTIALDWMHEAFRAAPVLGSLLNPAQTNAAKLVKWNELSSALEQALTQEQSDEQQEVAVVAHGLAKAATLLAEQYQWVITNVPYLTRGKQNEWMRKFCERRYPAAKNDLATVFLDRCLELCVEAGTSSIVLPQNWLFLTSYKKFRKKLLENDTMHLIARLGPGAFETISGEVVKAILITLSRGDLSKEPGVLFANTNADDGNLIRGVDVSEFRSAAEKAEKLLTTNIKCAGQATQLNNPSYVIRIGSDIESQLLVDSADCFLGICTGDMPRFACFFWEHIVINNDWQFFRSTPSETKHWDGMEKVLLWEKGNGTLESFVQEKLGSKNTGAWIRGKKCWGNRGVAVKQMGSLPVSLYNGELFDDNVAVIIPEYEELSEAIFSFSSSDFFNLEVRKVNQKLAVKAKYFLQAEFDLGHWKKSANSNYPNGLPKPYTDDPTQWIFHGHPCGSVDWDENKKWTALGPLRTDATVMHVAVVRLLGYCWPAELDISMELADEQREWANRCESLLPFSDDDGIVCIPPVRGEASASERLLNLLAAAYGDAWEVNTLAELLKSAGHAGKTLETWLREKFFTQHCKMFQHRPFIWHIWDGLRDGFSALVNYHKLDAKLLETLIYTYLGDWISRQKQDIDSGVDGAQERLAAADALKKKLELVLEGEAPHDIFVRWKPIENQPIGWNPDLNDGVRLNIRPFMTVGDVKKKGAGVLRDKPNIKWGKDRGKDVASAPWYHLFNGDRINDHHLSLAEKQAAREAKEIKT